MSNKPIRVTFEVIVVIRGQHVDTAKHHVTVDNIHDDGLWIGKVATLAVAMVKPHLTGEVGEIADAKGDATLESIITHSLEKQRTYSHDNNTMINHIRQQFEAGPIAAMVSLWFEEVN